MMWVMQGESDRQRELLDVESVAGHLLEPGSVFALLAEHRDRLFQDELFADLFPSGRGRPSIPGEVIASVIVLQALFGHSDREAVDALTFDLRWKAACGYPVDAKGFNSSTLTYWRRRLAASDRPQRIFEVVRQVIAETGAVKAKTRRALDSTVLDDAVARQDTITQLIAQIRRVGREVPGAKELIATECTRLAAVCGQDYIASGKPRIAWDDQAARDELVSALVADALALLAALDVEAITAAGGKPAEAVALLALVAGQDVEPAEDSDGTDGRWRIARRTAPDRVISTVDPDARHAHKTRQRRQDGFKAHIVVEPDTGLTTMCALTKPNGPSNSDAAVGAGLVTADPTDDFTFDAAAGTLTCPGNITRGLSAKGNATFGAACRGCPLRQRCTTSATGRKVVLGEHHLLQRQHRQRAGDEDFKTVYRQHRPMVERSIAWLTRGARRVPYRGVEKNNTWLHHRVAALNLRRLLAMGLTNQNGTWALA